MATEDSNITERTEDKSIWQMSTRETIRHLRGGEVTEVIGTEHSIPYEDVDYVCQSCGESISPELDQPDEGECPHCGNAHTQPVKTSAGASGLFTMLAIIAGITVVGIIVAPAFWLVAGYFSRKANRHLRDESNRVGQFVDEEGEPVPELSEYVEDGWTVETQTTDGFVMDKTTWGSMRMHWILAVACCWTFGWANIIYAFVKMESEERTVVTQ